MLRINNIYGPNQWNVKVPIFHHFKSDIQFFDSQLSFLFKTSVKLFLIKIYAVFEEEFYFGRLFGINVAECF